MGQPPRRVHQSSKKKMVTKSAQKGKEMKGEAVSNVAGKTAKKGSGKEVEWHKVLFRELVRAKMSLDGYKNLEYLIEMNWKNGKNELLD
jgi:hypothetical protein